MTTTPTLNGQVIGQAERAVRAVLDRLLTRTGTGFTEWTTLNLTATAGGSYAEAALIATLATGLKVAPAVAESAIATLLTDGLFTRTADTLTLTTAGQARHDEIRAGIAGITARLYHDLPPADLTAAARILTTITDRANAELLA